MNESPKTPPAAARTQDQAIAEIIVRMNEIYAAREAANPAPEPGPKPGPPRDPWVDKPGPPIAAEKEVWQWGLIEKLQLGWCKRPGGCALGRCKRSGRCAKIEEMRPEMERARAALAAAQARWPRPADLAEAPRRRPRGT
jgi:hypothetical protein